MAWAGQGKDFFQFIGDVEKENKKENGGRFPGLGVFSWNICGIFAQKSLFEVKEGNTVFRKSFHIRWCLLARVDLKYDHKIALNLEFSWNFFGGEPLFWLFSAKTLFLDFFLRKKKSIFWLLLGESSSFCYRFIPSAHRAAPYCHLHQPQLLQNTEFGEILKTQDNFSSLEPLFPHRRLQTSAINSLENWEVNYLALETLITCYTDPVRAGKKPLTLKQIFSVCFFFFF